jgi:hypothetical protein
MRGCPCQYPWCEQCGGTLSFAEADLEGYVLAQDSAQGSDPPDTRAGARFEEQKAQERLISQSSH